ncbi:MAG TPA: PadR family transcriptional regulator [Solirubrobacterales bacterium]|jgi:PadR family transcriptional regulator, regulatory protein PadR|nr:PadR family transcriptional regulator [Solirubrobacterales bacterium]
MAQRRGRKPVADAVARAARAARETDGRRSRRGGGAMDVFGGEIRRRDMVPLLVLHLIQREPAYGNRLIEEIEAITEGVISVNPNTIYPLLRELEEQGMIKGEWEHPDRRTRRYYAITSAGRREHRRLVAELEPFLDSVIRSVTLIKREIYGTDT